MPNTAQKELKTQEIQTQDIRFDARVSKDAAGEDIGKGFFSGYASTEALDTYRTRFLKGAFSESIKRRGFTGGKGIKLLLNHDRSQLAGVIKKLEPSDKGLYMEGQLNLEIQAVRDFYSAAKMINGMGLSIGFRSPEFKKSGEAETVGIIEKADLVEVSLTPFPSNEEAELSGLRAQGESVNTEPSPAATESAAGSDNESLKRALSVLGNIREGLKTDAETREKKAQRARFARAMTQLKTVRAALNSNR